MLLKSPEERAQLWREVSAAQDDEQRELLLRALATGALEELRSEFDLYSSYEDPFIDTFLLLDRCGRLLDAELLLRYQALALDDEDRGRKFFGSVIDRLAQITDDQSADPALRRQAADFYVLWREHIPSQEELWLSVAEVAKRYDVVVQTVYKWISQGKISAWRTPGGGGTRVPVGQFTEGLVDATLTDLAAETGEGDAAVGPVRRLRSASEPAYQKVLEAIEAGRIPQLPRRRYLPARAAALNKAEELVPRESDVDGFREDKLPTRRGPYRKREG